MYSSEANTYNQFSKDIFLKKWANPCLFFCLFSVFSDKHFKFLQQIYVKKCPSRIWCRDSNPRPLECESPPITTRPGLPSKDIFLTTISPIANNTIPQCDTYPKSQASAALGGIIPN